VSVALVVSLLTPPFFLSCRCQWKHEGTLRKHRIVNNRNRDTILYSMLNTDWIPASVALKKHIGLDWKPKTVKIADIQSGKDAVPVPTPATKITAPISAASATSSQSVSPSTAAKVTKKSQKKKANSHLNKRREKYESSSDEEDDDDDQLLVPMIATSQPQQKRKKGEAARRTDNISHAFISSLETPPPVASSNGHPLDLSDPNLYGEDHASIPLAAIDWQPVEKKTKAKKKK
jgi:hypothetical protein